MNHQVCGGGGGGGKRTPMMGKQSALRRPDRARATEITRAELRAENRLARRTAVPQFRSSAVARASHLLVALRDALVGALVRVPLAEAAATLAQPAHVRLVLRDLARLVLVTRDLQPSRHARCSTPTHA